MTPTTREALRVAITQAQLTDDDRHLEAAERLLDDLPPTPLVECPGCGRTGVLERVLAHDC
jgi:hypothetical protein